MTGPTWACKVCEMINLPVSTACESCGRVRPDQLPENRVKPGELFRYCEACGTGNPPRWTYCRDCGKKFEK